MTDEFKMDKTAIHKYKLGSEPTDLEYWLSRPAEERIAAIEFLREQYHTEDEIKQGLQRVCRIIKLEKG
jgi:hypothetical protein